MNKIIAIGGTGQDVLHYYLLAYLVGAIDDPFDALVIDAEELRPSLRAAEVLFRNLPTSTQHSMGVEVPRIKRIAPRVDGGNTDVKVRTILSTEEATDFGLADAFYDTDSLEQTVSKGLYARPALSALLTLPAQKEDLLSDGRIVIVSSILGGTGGGLTAPIVDRVRRLGVDNGAAPEIRLVLAGEYFTPDEGGDSRIDLKTMRSNQHLVLRSIKDSLAPSIRSFSLVGGPGTRLEKRLNTSSASWPDTESHPIWRAVVATHFHMLETIDEAAADFGRKYSPPGKQPAGKTLELGKAKERVQHAWNAASTFVRKDVVSRVWNEPQAWPGPRSMIAALWRVSNGGTAFTRGVSAALRGYWNALESCGPSPGRELSPGEISAFAWPEPAALDPACFNSEAEAAKTVAANLLFHCLRNRTSKGATA